MSALGLQNIQLSFQTQFGTFVIEPDTHNSAMFCLRLEMAERAAQTLGHYYQINDAIVAVVQQQSGCAQWDALAPQELPYRVFDIICWHEQTPTAA